MNPLLLALLIGGGYIVYNSSQKSSTPTNTKLDPGYKIIIPCKQFDIYNEEASYKYAYSEFSKLIPKLLILIKENQQNPNESAAFNKIMEDFQMKMFGCFPGNIVTVLTPNYYAWIYRILRAGLKALVDKGPTLLKITKEQATKQANTILMYELDAIQAAGLDTEGLPDSVEGDF